MWRPYGAFVATYGTLTVPTWSLCSHLTKFDLRNHTVIMRSPLLSLPLLPQSVRLFDFKRSYLETVNQRIIWRPYSGRTICDQVALWTGFQHPDKLKLSNKHLFQAGESRFSKQTSCWFQGLYSLRGTAFSDKSPEVSKPRGMGLEWSDCSGFDSVSAAVLLRHLSHLSNIRAM